LVDEAGVFARGEAVPGADGPEADERFESRVDDSPLDRQPADGIGSIEDENAQLVPGGGLHGEAQGREVRVVAAAYVLHVEDQRVEVAQVLVLRRQRGKVLAV